MTEGIIECGAFRVVVVRAEKTGDHWIFFFHALQVAELHEFLCYLAAVYGKRFTWRDAARGLDYITGAADDR